MRLSRFSADETDAPRLGVRLDDTGPLVDLARAGDALGIDLPGTTRDLLAHPRWQPLAATVAEYGRETGTGVYDPGDVETLAPVSDPQKVVCVGLNYAEHAAEGDQETPEEPLLFSKFPSAIVGPGEPVVWDPAYTDQVDYEVELAAVVGQRARRVDPADAMDAVAGFTVANDVSARDVQFSDDQWVRGKSLDTFCPLGPELVTTDAIDDPHALPLWTEVNGDRVQESSTDDLIFDVPELVSFASEAFTLVPGDVVLTGTPPGVGVFREPQLLLDDGDVVTVCVEGIGTLENPCEHG